MKKLIQFLKNLFKKKQLEPVKAPKLKKAANPSRSVKKEK